MKDQFYNYPEETKVKKYYTKVDQTENTAENRADRQKNSTGDQDLMLFQISRELLYEVKFLNSCYQIYQISQSDNQCTTDNI